MAKRLTAIQIGIIVTTLITAGIHLSLLFPDWLFILNALGYLGLLGLYFLPAFSQHHKLIRWAYLLFTLVTLGAWVLIGERSTLAYITKLDEIILVILLLLDKS